jgi:hypothetical protein
LVSTSRGASGSSVGWSSWSSAAASTRATASERDQPLFGHVDRDLQRRLRRPLARARLEHPELALLHGELDVLHVAIMRLQDVEDVGELRVGLGQRFFHRERLGPGPFARARGQILRRADAGDDILALRIDEILAIISVLAGRGIARESDARRRGVAHIAEHHGLHVDGRAPFAGNAVQAAIDLGPLGLPGAEHGADRAPELLMHVLREGLAPLLLDEGLILGDQRLPVLGGQLGVEESPLVLLGDFQRFLELGVIELEHDIRIHLDEAAIAVPRKARIARCRRETLHGLVIEAEVQHRVHHAWHGNAGARADRDQQRIGLVAELLAGDRLDMGNAVGDFDLHALRIGLAIRIIARTHLGRDRETGRHRQADRCHAIQIGALAAEEILVALAAVINAATETIDIFTHQTFHPAFRHVNLAHRSDRKCRPNQRTRTLVVSALPLNF